MAKYRVWLNVTEVFEQKIDVEAADEAAVRKAFRRLYNEGTEGSELSGLIDPITLDELELLRAAEDDMVLLESHDEVREIIQLED